MTAFPNPLEGRFAENRRKFTLTRDFIYDDPKKDIRVVVPEGFTTDWNSVPQPLWAYFSPWDYPEAGLVHDWLYASPKGFASPSLKPPLDRAACDDIHRRILELVGCRWTKRQAIWLALRAFGGVAWNRHRAEDTTSSGPATP